MKLAYKLTFSFAIILILLITLAILSWNTANTFNRQSKLIGYSDQAAAITYDAGLQAYSALATKDLAPFKTANDRYNEAINLMTSFLEGAKMPTTQKVATTIHDNLHKIILNLETLKEEFKTYLELEEKFTLTGREISFQMENEIERTGDGKLAEFRGVFLSARLACISYIATPNKKAETVVENYFKELNERMDEFKNYNRYTEIISRITEYRQLVNMLVESYKDYINANKQRAKLADTTLNDMKTLAQLCIEIFNNTRKNIQQQLIFTTILSIFIGTLLTIFITRNVLKQLGTDPQILAELAERVTNGDYNINDGKQHTGVYHNIIIMVEKMKDALAFSQNILASFPIPTAVFGIDNKLKFANTEMMNLLENPNKMEDCIGQTSGEFMFNESNKNTCTLKAINSKETINNQQEFTTRKGVNKTIDATAQPLKDRNGNITDTITVWRDITEQTLAAKKIEEANEHMQNIAHELEQVANIASSATQQLSAQIELSENGANDQADRVETTATALEEMNATVLEIARNASTTADSASTVRAEASAGSQSMQECVQAMNDVREELIKLQEEMGVLSEHAQAINEIMNVISDIADQTNLLALNAAIEAARAGEAGRGFAVVADEVRNLAEKTMASTTDVGNAINSIQKSTTDNTKLVIAAVEKIEKVTEMVSKAGDSLHGIVNLADTTADQVRAIATASEEQSATSEEITQSVESINNIAKENTINMREARQAVNEVVNQSHVLSQLIEQLQQKS